MPFILQRTRIINHPKSLKINDSFSNVLIHFLKTFSRTNNLHCVKSVLIRSFFWSVFFCIRTEYGDLLRKSPYSVRIQENTEQKKTPYLDTFHAVSAATFSDHLPQFLVI